jgi:GTP pyrophosphokinase
MIEVLLEKIQNNCTNVDIEMIKKAYSFAEQAHKDQMRESGEPYIIHPVDVACILADMGMDTGTIVAGLLHDVIEDTKYTFEDVTREFSEEVANIVEGVTKLGKVEYKTKEEQKADNIRKMLLAMTKDIRIILVKLADRLHNMRTLKFKAANKQKDTAKETLDIYAPLAHRLGMSKIKWELEDLAFRYINPEEYYDLVKNIASKRVEREAYIKEIKDDLNTNLLNAGIRADIDGRPKHFYSIYMKMTNKGKNIDQIFDLTAVRILVESVKDCYAALGIVHTMYKPIPGRFKDYIAMPKPNMYQSLHSTVIGKGGKPFEIQIRTYEMHKTAEYGIAAHWVYKETNSSTVKNTAPVVDEGENLEGRLSWLGDMLEWQRDTKDATEFMEAFKIDLFSDEVFVFTPNGKVIDLPQGATPIDFAYKIHTDIGNRCIGAKVNGKMVSLDYQLNTGEIVEVITSSFAKGPSIAWLNIAKSNQAKAKIKSWFKKANKDENLGKGKEALEKESKKQGCNFGEIIKGDEIEKILKKYHFNNMEELYVSVGISIISASSIVSRLKEAHIKNNPISLEDIEEQVSKTTPKIPKNNTNGITVKGITNVLVRFSKCCNPVPGDEIVGYITRGRGVSIHRKDCKNLEDLMEDDENKFIEVSWNGESSPSYVAQIQIKADDREGLLSEIMIALTESKINLEAINGKTVRTGFALVTAKVRITGVNQLKDLMKKIKRLKGVNEVYRTKY